MKKPFLLFLILTTISLITSCFGYFYKYVAPLTVRYLLVKNNIIVDSLKLEDENCEFEDHLFDGEAPFNHTWTDYFSKEDFLIDNLDKLNDTMIFKYKCNDYLLFTHNDTSYITSVCSYMNPEIYTIVKETDCDSVIKTVSIGNWFRREKTTY